MTKSNVPQLHSEMFCAGHKAGKHDACLGDSGGPLIIHYKGRWENNEENNKRNKTKTLCSRWTLIGITSAGFGCAVDKQPGIYHKIGKTTGWINSQISSRIP